jgi:hypothetical protein
MFIIKKKRIINTEAYLAPLEKNTRFRVVVPLSENLTSHLRKIGFTEFLSGARLLPQPCGSVSKYNADGKWVVFKDQPKESRFIRTVIWHWKQWAGKDDVQELSDERDIYKDCYARELLPPPCVELTILEQSGTQYISSDALTNSDTHYENNRHVINLFLEIFGFCQLTQENFNSFDNIKLRQLNWEILPAGEYPWEKIAVVLNK